MYHIIFVRMIRAIRKGNSLFLMKVQDKTGVLVSEYNVTCQLFHLVKSTC